MDVAAQKKAARALEQKGQPDEALKVYREIVDHLEGTPAMLKELPLYVKVGDLALKAGDRKAAVRMYDRAAVRCAEQGSGKRVIGLCDKIRRVVPHWSHIHLRYTRVLIDKNHLADAREVLTDYAEGAELPKALAALKAASGLFDTELKAVLEMLLEGAERTEKSSAAAKIDIDSGEVEMPKAKAASPPPSEPEVAEEASGTSDDIVIEPSIVQPKDDEASVSKRESDSFIAKGMTDMLDPSSATATEDEETVEASDRPSISADVPIVKSGAVWEDEASELDSGEVPEPMASLDEEAEAEEAEEEVVAGALEPDGPLVDSGPVAVGADAYEIESPDVDAHRDSGIYMPDNVVGDIPESLLADPGFIGETGVENDGPLSPTMHDSGPVPTRAPRPSDAYSQPSRRSASYTQPRRTASYKPIRAKGSTGKIKAVMAGGALLLASIMGVRLSGLLSADGEVPAAANAADAPAAANAGSGSNAGPSQPVALPDSLEVNTDSASEPTASFTPPASTPVPQSRPQRQARPTRQTQTPTRTQTPPPRTQPTPTPRTQPVPVPVESVPVIHVDGLPVQSAVEFSADDRIGMRVVQALATGQRLTLTIYRLTAEERTSLVDGQVRVNINADGSAAGRVRYGDFLVRARGPISMLVLEPLLHDLARR